MSHELSVFQIASLIESGPAMLDVMLSDVAEKMASWHPAEGEWCIKEVLGHMIEADKNGFDGRIRTILAEDKPQLKGWDIPGTVAARQDCEKDFRDLLAEWQDGRSESADMIVDLTDEQMNRSGVHPMVGELTIRDLLYEWVYHDQNHIKQILSNVQSFVWLKMGNSQKFAGL